MRWRKEEDWLLPTSGSTIIKGARHLGQTCQEQGKREQNSCTWVVQPVLDLHSWPSSGSLICIPNYLQLLIGNFLDYLVSNLLSLFCSLSSSLVVMALKLSKRLFSLPTSLTALWFSNERSVVVLTWFKKSPPTFPMCHTDLGHLYPAGLPHAFWARVSKARCRFTYLTLCI